MTRLLLHNPPCPALGDAHAQLPFHLLPDALSGASARRTPPANYRLLHFVELRSACLVSLPRAPSPVCDEPRRSSPAARPISAPVLHPAFLVDLPQCRPHKAPPAVQRALLALLAYFSPVCAPRSYTSTAAATRRQTRPHAPRREVQTAASQMSRRSSTTRSVILVTGRAAYHGYDPDDTP